MYLIFKARDESFICWPQLTFYRYRAKYSCTQQTDGAIWTILQASISTDPDLPLLGLHKKKLPYGIRLH